MSTTKRILNYIKAGFPGLAIETSEEQRACADVIAAAKEAGKRIGTWTTTEGLKVIYPEVLELENTFDLEPATERANQKDEEDIVWIFLDTQTWPVERNQVLARRLRDLLARGPERGNCSVFIGPSFKNHPTFEKLMTVMEYELPSPEDLKRIASNVLESAGQKGAEVSPEVIRALGGLSTTEAENACSLSLVEAKELVPDVIYREKIAAVKRTGLLEIASPDPRGLNGIGGLDSLKDWIGKRQRAYTDEARAFGLPLPKGVLLVGVPGTGKSLSARAIGTALGVPTVKLDVGSLFGSLVGESEQKTRDALALAEAMAPCVLWVDEIDKGLSGASGNGSTDSGVTRRVFGTIITWMQERKRPVFLVATANQVEALPPEFLRKGRFDEIFAVDLPSASEREMILKLQLARHAPTQKVKVEQALVKATEGFTGSELENAVTEAMFEAFSRGKNPKLTEADLQGAVAATVPLSVTAKEQIQSIRSWAKNRARFASKPEAEASAMTSKPGNRRLTSVKE